MPLAIRKQIRDAVIAKLVAANIVGNDAKGNPRVYSNRARKIYQNELPALLVYTNKETAEVSNEAPREYKRSPEIAVEMIVVANASGNSGLDDEIDALSVLIEAAIMNDETQGGLCEDTIIGDTELDIIEDGEQPLGAGKIIFTMPYYQYIPQVDTSTFPNLTTADVKIGPPEPQDEGKDNELSEDTVTLPSS